MIVFARDCEGMQLLLCWDGSSWPAPARGWRVRAVWAGSMWRRLLDQTDSDIWLFVELEPVATSPARQASSGGAASGLLRRHLCATVFAGCRCACGFVDYVC